MSKQSDAAKAGAVMALATALSLAAAHGAKAAEEPEVVTVDRTFLSLLEAIAQGEVGQIQTLGEIFKALEDMKIQVQGFPLNTDSLIAGREQVLALNTAYQMSSVVVPDGMQVLVKGWPTNGNLIYVGNSQATATNINSIWPLLPNEGVGYQIQNLDAIWFSGLQVGDWIGYTVEQRKES